ncbi:MAG: S-methyl-5'-thioinosine phosphorylase [Nostocoides sp.]
MDVRPLGLIAGTGFSSLATLTDAQDQSVGTAYGTARLVRGSWHGMPVAFLTRHGIGHTVPPHLVNYRANIAALRDVGVREILAVNVVGGIDPGLAPGSLVAVDDFLDFTKARAHTFVDADSPDGVTHTDVSHAYTPGLRAELLTAAHRVGTTLVDGGVYACFEGPRFESPAEIRLAALAGGTVAGMTGVPEVTLAAEAGVGYASICLVVNPAAGVSEEEITMDQINGHLATSAHQVLAILDEVLAARAAHHGETGPTRDGQS